ncbi:hypothetical protein M9Y10_028690 [Tritrichomonas musculus]|uniref:Nucleoplasmin-like domain-containing protein n=1 Tax=Tritrichomonas musculus TaxID=1915356 RepID=A0ABR2KKX2_9EUKA
MEIPNDFTSFWHAKVIPGKPCKITPRPRSECAITNIALHHEEDQVPQGNRTILYASVNNGEQIAVAPFTIGQFESTCVDIHFSDFDNLVLSIKGAEIPIDVVGTAVGEMPEVDNGVPPPPPPESEETQPAPSQ